MKSYLIISLILVAGFPYGGSVQEYDSVGAGDKSSRGGKTNVGVVGSESLVDGVRSGDGGVGAYDSGLPPPPPLHHPYSYGAGSSGYSPYGHEPYAHAHHSQYDEYANPYDSTKFDEEVDPRRARHGRAAPPPPPTGPHHSGHPEEYYPPPPPLYSHYQAPPGSRRHPADGAYGAYPPPPPPPPVYGGGHGYAEGYPHSRYGTGVPQSHLPPSSYYYSPIPPAPSSMHYPHHAPYPPSPYATPHPYPQAPYYPPPSHPAPHHPPYGHPYASPYPPPSPPPPPRTPQDAPPGQRNPSPGTGYYPPPPPPPPPFASRPSVSNSPIDDLSDLPPVPVSRGVGHGVGADSDASVLGSEVEKRINAEIRAALADLKKPKK